MIIDLHTAVRLLREGKVVALPTETVYGLGCLATDPEAVREVYRIKNRPPDNPLICHVPDLDMLLRYVQTPPAWVIRLVKRFCPGPISFLIALNENEGRHLRAATGGRDSVVMRIPEHPVTLEVIRLLGLPLAAPSANTSGKVSPTSARMVLEDLGDKVAGVLDGGPCRVGIESTIVDVREAGQVRIIRPGVIGVEELRAALGPDYGEIGVSMAAVLNETVPGNKYAHYAPDTPVFWVDKDALRERGIGPEEAVIGLKEDLEGLAAGRMVDLGSLIRDPEAVARDLYERLKSLDAMPLQRAWLLRFDPGTSSSGQAVWNRLQKVAQEPKAGL